MPELRRITEIPCHCPECEWRGVTGDCEPDDEGTLCCPRCFDILIPVDIEYNEHERNPKMTTLREGLPPLPLRMQHLPIDHRGYVVPWFVAKPPQGQPWDFRIADGEKNVLARRYGRCWVCGEKTGQRKTFVIGPMCAVNRITAEPGCHRDCALFSVQACPFLSLPQARRNERGLEGTSEPAGVMIKRNPGVTCLWSTELFTTMEVETGTLYRLGAPAAVEWWKEKRHATREEVLASIDSGMPLLRASARVESAEAEAGLERAYTEMIPLLPEAA